MFVAFSVKVNVEALITPAYSPVQMKPSVSCPSRAFGCMLKNDRKLLLFEVAPTAAKVKPIAKKNVRVMFTVFFFLFIVGTQKKKKILLFFLLVLLDPMMQESPKNGNPESR
jgi:hypothetical protein